MRNLFIVCLLLCGSTCCAQTEDCRGLIHLQVLEKHNLEIVYPAVIYIDELNKEYNVPEDGELSIRNLCPGTYTVHVHAYGYEHYAQVVSVKNRTNIKLMLSHIEHMLTEVNIAEKRPDFQLIQTHDELNKEEIVSRSGKTLSEMLETVNGVTLVSTGGNVSKPMIHGMSGNRIVILNNGIRQEDQQWGGEHAPTIDPFLANRITVVKGAAGVRYGTDALGGMVLVEPPALRANKPGWNGEINLAAFSNNRMGAASGMIEHNFKAIPALSFRLQGTWKQGGNYKAPEYWVANSGIAENNYSATLGWKKRHYSLETFYSHFETDLGVYRGAHTGNEKDLIAAIESKVPLVPADFTYQIDRPMQHVTHDLIKNKLMLETRAGVFNLIHSYQHNFRQEYDIVRGENERAQLNLTLNTQTLNLNLDHRQIGRFTGQIGVDGLYQENFSQAGDRVFLPNYRASNGAIYAIERYKAKNWAIEAGLRYDQKNYEVFNPEGSNQQVVRYDFDFSNYSGTLAFQHQLTKDWNWSITLAKAWRAPQPAELFSAGLHHSAARIELGNKYLQPERSSNINLDVVHHKTDKLRFEGSTYLQYVDDYIYLSPGAPLQTIRGYFKSFSYQQTDALLWGIDLSLVYHFSKHFRGHAKASFLRAEDMQQADWLIQMPSDRAAAGLRYTTDISKRFRQFFVGINGRMVLEQARIPVNFDKLDYPRPPDTYSLLDAEAGVEWMWNGRPVFFGASILNLSDVSYRDYMDAFRYFVDRPGRNFVLRMNIPFDF